MNKVFKFISRVSLLTLCIHLFVFFPTMLVLQLEEKEFIEGLDIWIIVILFTIGGYNLWSKIDDLIFNDKK